MCPVVVHWGHAPSPATAHTAQTARGCNNTRGARTSAAPAAGCARGRAPPRPWLPREACHAEATAARPRRRPSDGGREARLANDSAMRNPHSPSAPAAGCARGPGADAPRDYARRVPRVHNPARPRRHAQSAANGVGRAAAPCMRRAGQACDQANARPRWGKRAAHTRSTGQGALRPLACAALGQACDRAT